MTARFLRRFRFNDEPIQVPCACVDEKPMADRIREINQRNHLFWHPDEPVAQSSTTADGPKPITSLKALNEFLRNFWRGNR
jgi:hypothetical protein